MRGPTGDYNRAKLRFDSEYQALYLHVRRFRTLVMIESLFLRRKMRRDAASQFVCFRDDVVVGRMSRDVVSARLDAKSPASTDARDISR